MKKELLQLKKFYQTCLNGSYEDEGDKIFCEGMCDVVYNKYNRKREFKFKYTFKKTDALYKLIQENRPKYKKEHKLFWTVNKISGIEKRIDFINNLIERYDTKKN